MNVRDTLINLLNSGSITVEVSNADEALEVIKRISDITNIPLWEPKRKSFFNGSVPTPPHHGTLYAMVENLYHDGFEQCIALNFYVTYQKVATVGVGVYYTKDDFDALLSSNDVSNNLTGTISITNTVLTVTDLNNFSQNYGIDICTNKDGWLVVDGTNEAILSTDELTRYIETIESMSEIMKKFVRQ